MNLERVDNRIGNYHSGSSRNRYSVFPTYEDSIIEASNAANPLMTIGDAHL
jgi:hypothetical protein